MTKLQHPASTFVDCLPFNSTHILRSFIFADLRKLLLWFFFLNFRACWMCPKKHILLVLFFYHCWSIYLNIIDFDWAELSKILRVVYYIETKHFITLFLPFSNNSTKFYHFNIQISWQFSCLAISSHIVHSGPENHFVLLRWD